MSDFDKSIEVVLENEGGYVNDPNDTGGATKYGISLRYLRGLGDVDNDGFLDGDINHDNVVNSEDIKDLTQGLAKDFYKEIWQANKYWRLNDQYIATKLFDLAVNLGARQANKLIQRAVKAASNVDLLDDGIIGEKSIKAINECMPLILLAALKAQADSFYRNLSDSKPQYKKYINGWLKRLYKTY